MSLRTRLAAGLAAVAAALVIAPVGSAGADPPLGALGGGCGAGIGLAGVGLGSAGPYGPSGPWGPAGPMRGHPNPLGDAAQCGGFGAYILNGGTIESFVNANLASVGITGPSGG